MATNLIKDYSRYYTYATKRSGRSYFSHIKNLVEIQYVAHPKIDAILEKTNMEKLYHTFVKAVEQIFTKEQKNFGLDEFDFIRVTVMPQMEPTRYINPQTGQNDGTIRKENEMISTELTLTVSEPSGAGTKYEVTGGVAKNCEMYLVFSNILYGLAKEGGWNPKTAQSTFISALEKLISYEIRNRPLQGMVGVVKVVIMELKTLIESAFRMYITFIENIESNVQNKEALFKEKEYMVMVRDNIMREFQACGQKMWMDAQHGAHDIDLSMLARVINSLVAEDDVMGQFVDYWSQSESNALEIAKQQYGSALEEYGVYANKLKILAQQLEQKEITLNQLVTELRELKNLAG